MIWGCFRFCGLGSIVSVDGMLNSDKYMAVIQRKVIPHTWKKHILAVGHISARSCPIPCIEKGEGIFQETECNRLRMAWEITWSQSNRKCMVNCKMSFAKTGLYHHDQADWDHNTSVVSGPTIKENCKILVESMPKRVKKVLKNEFSEFCTLSQLIWTRL